MHHRRVRWIVPVLALAASVAAAEEPAPSTTPPFEAQVSHEEANVRADSNVVNDVLATLPRGSRVSVLGEHAGWYRIRLPKNARCYVATQYVDGGGLITGEHINVRAGAGPQYAILGQLRRGEHVRVLEKQAAWVRVEPLPSFSGWIRADLVAPLASSANTTAAIESATPMADKTGASGLAATTVATLAQESAMTATAATHLPPTATGILEPAHGFRQPSRHRLTLGGQTVFYLRSDSVDLSQYKHQHVAVWGVMDPTVRAPHPLVIVQRVERAD